MRNAAWVSVIVLAASSAAAFTHGCFVLSHTAECCDTQLTICMGESGTWPCASFTNEGPHTIRIYRNANPGEKGRDTFIILEVDDCVRTPVTCSDIEGECDEGDPYGVLCIDAGVAGEECTGAL